MTREQAEDTIEGLQELISRGLQSVYLDMALAGMHQLLAAMNSEPVAYWRKAFSADGFCYADGINSKRYHDENPPLPLRDGDYWEVIPLYRHAQPVVPATLPCSVELKPGLIIGKGCKTETLLTALRRRADYNADIDAMTPEERAEHDASIKAFKAMLAAAPQEVK